MDYKVNYGSLNINGESFLDQAIDASNGVVKSMNPDGGVALSADSTVVRTSGDQAINGNKTFNGTVTINNEIVHNSTSFSTTDGIIEQNRGNTEADLADYGNYGVYTDGGGTKYRGIINKAGTDKFICFNNCTSQPISQLTPGTFDMATLLVKDATLPDECVNKRVLDAEIATIGTDYLAKSGGTMAGVIDMDDNDITLSTAQFRRKTDGTIAADIEFDATDPELNIKNFSGGNAGAINFLTARSGGSYAGTLNRLTIGTSTVEIKAADFIVDNFSTFNRQVDLTDNKLVNLATCTSDNDGANKAYADTKLSLSGGDMAGDLRMTTNKVLRYGNGETWYTQNTGSGNTLLFKPDTTSSKVWFKDGSGNNTFEINSIGTSEADVDVKLKLKVRGEAQFDNNINMSSSHVISGIQTPTADDHAANKGYCDTKLSLGGGNITGDTTITNSLLEIENGTAGDQNLLYFGTDRPWTFRTNNDDGNTHLELYSEVENKTFKIGSTTAGGDVDIMAFSSSGIKAFDEIDMSGNKITDLGTPTATTDAATKGYVDGLVGNPITVDQISGNLAVSGSLSNYGASWDTVITAGVYKLDMALNLSDGGTGSDGSVNTSALRFGTSSSVTGTSIAVSNVAMEMQVFKTDSTIGRSINCNFSYVFTQPVEPGVITLSAVAQTTGGAASLDYIRTFTLTKIS